jgi:UDP-MurNAc hydroxylase
MRRDLEENGFTNVIELHHGERFMFDTGFTLTSYQFFPYPDSAAVIDCEDITLFNANDAKFMGGPLNQILKRHPRIDFVFRSHSSANARVCYEIVDDPSIVLDDESSYTANFAAFVRRTNARYAIPFASNHCHLHKETFRYNSLIKTPQIVEDYFKNQKITRPELKVMVSGDAWSTQSGFQMTGKDYFEKREEHLEAYRLRMAPVLEKSYEKEAKTQISLQEVSNYFGEFFAQIPFYLRWFFRGNPITFVLSAGDAKRYFEVDFFKKQVRESSGELKEEPLEIHTSAYIFKNSMAVHLFFHIPGSKRVKYRIASRKRKYVQFLQFLFCLYEYEVPPVGRLTIRFFQSWFLRWREIFLYLRIAKDRALGKKFDERVYIES